MLRKNEWEINMKKLTALLLMCIFAAGLCPAAYAAYGGSSYINPTPTVNTEGRLIIEAENFDKGGSGIAYLSLNSDKAKIYRTSEYVTIVKLGTQTGIGLKKSEWVKYTVNASESGNYLLKAYAVNYRYDDCMEISTDGGAAISTEFSYIDSENNYEIKQNVMGLVYLAEGTNVIRIKCPSNFFYLDSFSLERYDMPQALYVDFENGDDDNCGSAEKPLKTVASAKMLARSAQKFRDGFYIYLKAGEHLISDTLYFNEKDGNVTYAVYGGENAVISSGKQVSDWTYDSEKNVYSAKADGAAVNSRQLYINGIRAIRAREENTLGIIDTSYDSDACYTSDRRFLNFKNISDIEFVYFDKWFNNRFKIAAASEENGRIRLEMQKPAWSGILNYYQTSKSIRPEYMENAAEFLDKAGEFYIDKTEKMIYYIKREYEDLNTLKAVIPTLEQLIVIKPTENAESVKNIRFENLEFSYTKWNYPDTIGGFAANQDNMLYFVERSDSNMPKAAVSLEKADGISFGGCKFTHMGSSGVSCLFGTRNTEFVGNEFYDISGIALCMGDSYYHIGANLPSESMTVKNINVNNNYFHDNCVEYRSGAALSIGFAENISVTHNDFYNTTYSAVHIGSGWEAISESVLGDINISNNYFSDIMTGKLYDGGAIYTLGPSRKENPNNRICGNYIKNQYNSGGALYNDSGSFGWLAEDNVTDLEEVGQWSNYTELPQQPKWMLTNRSAEGDNIYRGNYTTTENCMIRQNIKVSGTHLYSGENIPPKAKKIADRAGLEKEYENLSDEIRDFEVSADEISLVCGEKKKIDISGFIYRKDVKTNKENVKLYYSSDNTDTADVTAEGVITGRSEGKTEVSAVLLSDGVLKERKIKVNVVDK